MIPNLLRLLALGNCNVYFLFISLLLSGCRRDSPAESETPKGLFVDKIAFTAWHESRNLPPLITVADLYNDSGTFRLYNRKELVEGLGASLSKDRTWIAYALVKNGIRPMRINVDGTQNWTIRFPENLAAQNVSISPDGSMIAVAFHSIQDIGTGIHIGIIPSNGGVPYIVYADSSASFSPDWSPDGKKIYFSWLDYKNRFGHNVPGSRRLKSYIVSINVDGTNWQPVSDTLSGLSNDSYPAVSPDGKRIVFNSQRNHPNNIFPEIFIMKNDGSGVQQLTQCFGCQRHEDHFDIYTDDGDPQWIKDGSHIIFQRDTYTYDHNTRQYNLLQDLYIMNPDGTGLQNLTNDGESALPKRSVR